MDSLTSNSKIKNLFLIILLSILFTITAISLQHPLTTQAKSLSDITTTTENYTALTASSELENFRKNQTELSTGGTHSYLFWNASTRRCGIVIYIVNNEGRQLAQRIYLDDEWVDDTDEDYLAMLNDGTFGSQSTVTNVTAFVPTSNTISTGGASYLSGISTVDYDSSTGTYPVGSEVMAWLQADSTYKLSLNGTDYLLPNWAKLVAENHNEIYLAQYLLSSDETKANWHVFIEPITVSFIYTMDTFDEDTPAPAWCGFEDNMWHKDDPKPSGNLINGVYYPTVYAADSISMISSIYTATNSKTGNSRTEWLFNTQLPFSMLLADNVDVKVGENDSVSLSRNTSDVFVLSSDCDGMSYIKRGIGIASLEIGMKGNTPIHTYDKDEGSPGDPEDTDDNTSGTNIIIKHYYKITKKYDSDGNLKTVTYDDIGTYTRKNTTNYVDVMDEASVSGYALKQWVTTDQDNFAVDVPDDYDAETSSGTYTEKEIKFHDTTGCIKVSTQATDPDAIESEQKYIILILVKEENNQEEIQLDDYFEITESSLTKLVWFSQVTLKLKEATFEWTRNQFDSKAA